MTQNKTNNRAEVRNRAEAFIKKEDPISRKDAETISKFVRDNLPPIPKICRARLIHHWITNLGFEGTVEELCGLMDISGGYYRSLRERYYTQWQEERLVIDEENTDELVKNANRQDIDPKNWKDMYGDLDRSQFIL